MKYTVYGKLSLIQLKLSVEPPPLPVFLHVGVDEAEIDAQVYSKPFVVKSYAEVDLWRRREHNMVFRLFDGEIKAVEFIHTEKPQQQFIGMVFDIKRIVLVGAGR